MRSLLRHLCSALIICLMLAGCSSVEETFDTDFVEEVKGFDGTVFRVQGLGDLTKTDCLGYGLDGVFGDMALERLRKVESDYDCRIVNDTVTSVPNSIGAGQTGLDIFRSQTFNQLGWTEAGYLVGFSILTDHLDYTDTDVWGTKYVNQRMCWNNDLYSVQPYGVPLLCFGNYYGALALNVGLCRQYNVHDPREYLEAGLWDYDHFRTALRDMTVDTGDKTIYAFKACRQYYFDMFARTNGSELVERNEKGEYVCGFFTEECKVALEAGHDIMYGDTAYCFVPNDDSSINAMLTEDCMMVNCMGQDIINNFVYKLEYVGTLPFPHGPALDNCNYSCFCESYFSSICIPVNCQDYDCSAILINALYSPYPEYPDQESLVDYVAKQVFFDRIDAETMFKCMKNTRSNFYYAGGRTLAENITRASSIPEVIEKFKSQLISNLENNGIINCVASADYMYDGVAND